MIKLREAELYDTRQITLLALKYHEGITYGDLYIEFHRVISSENGAIFVVDRNESILAFAQCELQYDSIENRSKPAVILRWICVEKEWQNMRFGKQLIKKCEKWAKNKKCQGIIFNYVDDQECHENGLSLLGFKEKEVVTRFHRIIE